jgi:sodium/potassium/calcium exchanger 6
LGISYLSSYVCTEPTLKPLIFSALLTWLIFLFSTLGISAADFFTPNLATLAELLGLDEDVAGVTFLAFGNGSPDLFSTFSAMRANSGTLAVGELLGAASFIVSCVVGSMCIIKPFTVEKVPFLRDVGFFTVAISVLLVTLWDGKVTFWESVSLVGLYVVYVVVVIWGSWWDRRQAQKRRLESEVQSEYAGESSPDATELNLPYLDERKLPF